MLQDPSPAYLPPIRLALHSLAGRMKCPEGTVYPQFGLEAQRGPVGMLGSLSAEERVVPMLTWEIALSTSCSAFRVSWLTYSCAGRGPAGLPELALCWKTHEGSVGDERGEALQHSLPSWSPFPRVGAIYGAL